MYVLCVCAHTRVFQWRSEDSLQESILLFSPSTMLDSGTKLTTFSVFRLVSKYLTYPPSHPIDSLFGDFL